ncbi:MAG: hypothetical protein CME20_01070 [Gemmatimonadetes bacterium]|nr:hypothetical protein [Gemmatimonadota bacterium]
MDAVRGAGKYGWLGALLVAGALAGCTVKPPQVPSTNWVVSISVADDRTTIEQVVSDRSDFLKIDDESLLTVDFTSDFNRREEVGNRLRVTPTSNTFGTPIGAINLPGQDLPNITVGLNAILGQDLETGATVPLIPGGGFEVDEVLPVLVGVRSLTVSEGSIQIDMINNLPLTLSSVRMALTDQGDSSLDIPAGAIDELDLGTVASGASASGTFSLAGRQISSALAISVTGQTEEGQNVVIDADAALSIAASISELTVERAFAVIPPQEFSASQVLAFPDDRIQVTRAVISEGGLTFNVTNEIDIIMEIELRLDDLRKADGSTNTFLITGLEPGQVSTVSFDLDDNEFAPEDPLELRISYAVRTEDSGEPVQIFSTGEVLVEAVTEDLVFSRVEGILNRVSLPVPSVTQTVDFPAGLDNVALQSTALSVNLTSGIGFRGSIDLDIQGTNSKGETGSLLISEVFQRGDPDNPVALTLAPSSEDLTDFLNLLPTEVSVTPTVQMGDGEGTEVIEPDHWVQIDEVNFVTQGIFRLKNDTRIEPDPIFRRQSDAEARDRISANLDSASVVTEIENHLPIGVRVSLRVAPNAEDVYGSEDLFENNQANGYLRIPKDGAFEVGAGQVDANGRVTQSTTSRQRITLSDDDALVFLREDGIYTGVLIELDQTPGDVALLGTDFVNVVAGAEIYMELNEDLVE